MVRAFFIDGPDHGTTRTFESDPPAEWLTVGEMSTQAILADPDPFASAPLRHRYTRTYRTRKGVLIYEYDGTV